MKIQSAFLLLAVGCAAEPDLDEADIEAEPGVVYGGPTCANGLFQTSELCVADEALVLPTDGMVRTVLAVDLDADGARDIVAITPTRLWLRYGTPGGGFGATYSFWTAGADYRDVAVGDFDGDTDPDIAIADAAMDRLVIKRNTAGTFGVGVWQYISTGDEPIRVLPARLDTDGNVDLAVLATGSNQIDIFRATGAPFAARIPYDAGDAGDIAIGDCNFDGRRDIMYINGTGLGTSIRARRVFDNFANLTAPIATAMPLSLVPYGPLTPFVLASADFDNDTFSDVAVSTSWARIAPARSNGNCTFAPQPLAVTWAWVLTRLRAFDWDANGNPDLAAPHGVLGDGGDDNYSIAFGNGAGGFSYRYEQHDSDVVIPQDLAFLDGNGDSRIDVLIGGKDGVYLERRTH